MSPNYDPAEFVDADFQAHQSPTRSTPPATVPHQRAPSREELDATISETQQKLAELKRAQETLERERSALEETRRRQMELQTGRQEMLQQITRGIGLLSEAEFSSRRDAEQMAKALADLRDALAKIECIQPEAWKEDSLEVELTRALTAVENARMEWNSARLKFPVLSGVVEQEQEKSTAQPGATGHLAGASFSELCRIGLALTWPVVGVGMLILVVLLLFLFRR